MAGAVFFLLLGMLCTEMAAIGLDWAGAAGTALLTLCATVLVHLAFTDWAARRSATSTDGQRQRSRRAVTA